jgi:UDP-N-acetylglucosamine enolpyruvyl transferase
LPNRYISSTTNDHHAAASPNHAIVPDSVETGTYIPATAARNRAIAKKIREIPSYTRAIGIHIGKIATDSQ